MVGTLPEDEYVGINRRRGVYFLGQSQHVRGVIVPLSLSTIHHRPDSLCLFGQVIDTIDSIGLHLRTMFYISTKNNQCCSHVKVKFIVNKGFLLLKLLIE